MGDDAYLWLEAIDGEQALDWVERHNGPILAGLSGDRFEIGTERSHDGSGVPE